MFKQLKKCQTEMVEKKISLRAMYEELMDMCHKPDAELLQVGTEHLSRNILCYQQPTTLTSIIW